MSFKPFSKRELEGYVCIDHTNSPGFTPEEAVKAGRSQLAGLVGAGRKLEAATNFCTHCERTVVMNPDRTRERPWCWNCDHYICDGCSYEAKQPGYVHKSYKEKMDDFMKFIAQRKLIT